MRGYQEIGLFVIIVISALRIAATARGVKPTPESYVMAHLAIICAAFALIVRLP